MPVGHERDLETIVMNGENMANTAKKVVVGPKEGFDEGVLRLFILGPGGHSPKHTHDWYHVNWIVRGKGILHIDGEDHPVEPGSYAYVPGNALHQFRNAGEGDENFAFLCWVPRGRD